MLRAFAIATIGAMLELQICAGPHELLSNQSKLHQAQVDATRLQRVGLHLRTVDPVLPAIDKTQYKKEESVSIEVLALNSNSRPVFLLYSRLLVQFLPELSKGGEPIAYSKEMKKRVEDSNKWEARWQDRNTLRIDSTISVKLPPNELTKATAFSLSSYYPKLEPGIYTLRVKYREPNGLEIVSDSVMFEVVE